MSPIEIEAYRAISFKITSKNLKTSQVEKIDIRGKKFPVIVGNLGFATILGREKAVIPDVPGLVKVETNDSSMTIFKQSSRCGDSVPEKDYVEIRIEAEGYGFAEGEERPSIRKIHSSLVEDLKNEPVIVYFGKRKLAKVSWKKGGER